MTPVKKLNEFATVLALMWSNEIIHFWTAVVDESEEWSSQWIFQFKQLERRSLKKKKNQGFNLISIVEVILPGVPEPLSRDKAIDPDTFFSTYDMDKLGKIRQHQWKEHLLVKTSEDIAW